MQNFVFFFFFVDPHPFGGIYSDGVNDRDGGKTGIRQNFFPNAIG